VAEGIVTVVEHIEDRTRTATYAYLSTGELTSITDAAAAVTPMRHDLLGRRLSLDSADAGPTRFTRVGNLTSIVNARGVSVDARIPALTQQVELHNDDLHRLIRVGTWQSTTTLAPGTPLEAATTRVWDGTTRTWTLTSPEGRVVAVTLDDQGRAVSLRPAGLTETRLEYDANGRLSRASRMDGAEVREVALGYGGDARWASTLTDGVPAESSVTHDALGRATSVTSPSGATAGLDYDDATRALRVTGFGSMAAHELTYDPRGALASYTPPPSSGASAGTARYAYDADGALATLSLPDGGLVTILRDAAGRATGAALAAGAWTLGYDDATGQLRSASMPNAAGTQSLALRYDGPLLTRQRYSGAAMADVDFAYDELLRVSAVSVGGARTDYGYDRDGLLMSVGPETLARDAESGLVTASTAGGVGQSFTTSGLVELRQHSARWSGGRFDERIDARDGAGRMLEKSETTRAGLSTHGYRYDADGRLTQELRAGVRVASYDYDAQGNRTQRRRYDALTGAQVESHTARYDARDRLLDDGTASYGYDDAGRRATKTDAAGNLTRYAYDELGHLIRVELPSGLTVQYTYDALGRRTGRTTDGAVDGPADTAWVYGAGPAPLAALTGDGTLRARFLYGTRSWLPDVVQLQNGPEVDGDYVVVSDHRGSVRDLVGPAGSIARSDYDAFGLRSGTRLPILGFAFAGGILDDATGLLHLGARDYDPETGTWIEPDPIRFAGGDTNLYAYAGNDPINFVDPSGRDDLAVANWLDDHGIDDIAAGFGDAISFGATKWFRQVSGINGTINHCSFAYIGGAVTGFAVQTLLLSGAGAARGGATGAARATELLRPAGRLIGRAGTSARTRILQGGQTEAETLFNQLVRETGATPVSKPGLAGFAELPGGGGTIGFRTVSTSGPPTIDVRVPGLGIREIKFIP